jgi:hypothetical protein
MFIPLKKSFVIYDWPMIWVGPMKHEMIIQQEHYGKDKGVSGCVKRKVNGALNALRRKKDLRIRIIEGGNN